MLRGSRVERCRGFLLFSALLAGACSRAPEARIKQALTSIPVVSTDYNAIQAKPLDGSAHNPYNNSDHAGTPESFKSFVVGGARGGGGSNYTGSLSGTVTVVPVQACSGVTCPGPDQCHLQGACDPR